MISDFAELLSRRIPELEIRVGERLEFHTSFRIGGPASCMVFPKSAEQLSRCLAVLHENGLRPRILGGGTNILAPDEGISDVVICLRGGLDAISAVNDCELEADAGAALSRLAVFARDLGLTGLEFAHGIPGTVGGGVYMNAGAYGGELCRLVTEVTVLSPDGKSRVIPCGEKTFGYRTSRFEGSEDVIVRARFRLSQGDKAEIQQKMNELTQRRRASQPLEYPSAGSTFKRPAGAYAAALIDEAGLKGLRVGDAEVSRKHAGFVVNRGKATSAEVRALMAQIQKTVEEKSGFRLEPEVRIW